MANISLFLGDMGVQLGALTPGLLRLPRPGARPQPDRGRHRRPVPPELRPHRRPEGRPAQGLDRRDARRSWRRCGSSATRWKTCSWATRSSRPACRGIGVIPPRRGARPTACPAPTSGPAGSTGTSAGTPTRAWPGTRSTGRSGPIPTATASPATGCVCRRPARPPHRRPAAATASRRADHGEGAPHHQGAGRRGLCLHREPPRRDGLLRRQPGRPRPVPGEDPHRRRSTTSRSCPG